MNEAKQTELLPTMPEKDLSKLIKRLELQVADLTASIAHYEESITIAGAQKEIDKLDAILGRSSSPHPFNSPVEVARLNKQYYGKTNETRKAKLITKTRRLNAAREEVGNRNRQVIFGSRESIA